MPDDQRDGVAVIRRAPFSGNPQVGARGLRTQQRILDAAVRAFGEVGYPACTVDRITSLARCSRITFYQYFANKEDVFGHLAGQVARQVSASTEIVDPITADGEGWAALRTWVARYAEIHTRYEPVFHAYERDEALAAVAWHTGEETVSRIRARLATTTLSPRQVDPVIRMLLECLNHTLDVAGVLRAAAPDGYAGERIERAVADVMHRTLFGVQPDVNVHPADELRPPHQRSSPEMLELLRPDHDLAAAPKSNSVLEALLAAGRQVFIESGYHDARVDDVAVAAGVSHGTFYRYFTSKDELARVLTAQALQAVGAVATEFPGRTALDGAGASVLRRWLQRYHAAHAGEAAMLQVWVDAALQAPALRAESAPILDIGRRRFAHHLQQRGFGDPDIEAVALVALLGVFGTRARPAAEVDATALIIERGLLGGAA